MAICPTVDSRPTWNSSMIDAEPREHVYVDVGFQVVETGHADQPQVPDQEARRQLAQHRRLVEAHGEVAAKLCRHQDERNREDDGCNRIQRRVPPMPD